MAEDKQVAQYVRGKNGQKSFYISVGGTESSPGARFFAKGEYAEARSLFPKSFITRAVEKLKIVLKPISKNLAEAKRKYNFFKKLYPLDTVELFEYSQEDYRLVLRRKPGMPYGDYAKNINSRGDQVRLFISAIQALKHCHEENLVISDLHANNIFFDFTTGKSYLIDGGLSGPEDGSSHTKDEDINDLGHMMFKVFTSSRIPIGAFLRDKIDSCTLYDSQSIKLPSEFLETLEKDLLAELARGDDIEESSKEEIGESEEETEQQKKTEGHYNLLGKRGALFWNRYGLSLKRSLLHACLTLGFSVILYLLSRFVKVVIAYSLGKIKKIGSGWYSHYKRLYGKRSFKAKFFWLPYAFFSLLEKICVSLLSPFSLYRSINPKHPIASKIFLAVALSTIFFFAASVINALVGEIFSASMVASIVNFFASLSLVPGLGSAGITISNTLVVPVLDAFNVSVELGMVFGMTTFLLAVAISKITEVFIHKLIRPLDTHVLLIMNDKFPGNFSLGLSMDAKWHENYEANYIKRFRVGKKLSGSTSEEGEFGKNEDSMDHSSSLSSSS